MPVVPEMYYLANNLILEHFLENINQGYVHHKPGHNSPSDVLLIYH